jgi:hypothetical protein
LKQEGALSLGCQDVAALLGLDERITALEQGGRPCMQSLANVVVGAEPGRTSWNEIIILDSTLNSVAGRGGGAGL